MIQSCFFLSFSGSLKDIFWENIAVIWHFVGVNVWGNFQVVGKLQFFVVILFQAA